jgi:hypothetical protein
MMPTMFKNKLAAQKAANQASKRSGATYGIMRTHNADGKSRWVLVRESAQ